MTELIIRAVVIVLACFGASVLLGLVVAYLMTREAFEREIDALSVVKADSLRALARWETSTELDTHSCVWWAGGASISNYERKRMN